MRPYSPVRCNERCDVPAEAASAQGGNEAGGLFQHPAGALDPRPMMAYLFMMEKPGWGVVAVIAAGIIVLAAFLVLPDRESNDSTGSEKGVSGPAKFGDERTKNMARDTMRVVDGTESTEEIVRGSAEPAPKPQYDPAGGLVMGAGNPRSLAGSPDHNLAGYLGSLTSAPPRSLFDSIQAGDVSAVHNMIDSGADVHQSDQARNSLMHHAATQGSVEIGAFLIRYGADVNAVNNDGSTPLDLARSAGNAQFEELLLAYGARPGKGSDPRPVSVPE